MTLFGKPLQTDLSGVIGVTRIQCDGFLINKRNPDVETKENQKKNLFKVKTEARLAKDCQKATRS